MNENLPENVGVQTTTGPDVELCVMVFQTDNPDIVFPEWVRTGLIRSDNQAVFLCPEGFGIPWITVFLAAGFDGVPIEQVTYPTEGDGHPYVSSECLAKLFPEKAESIGRAAQTVVDTFLKLTPEQIQKAQAEANLPKVQNFDYES